MKTFILTFSLSFVFCSTSYSQNEINEILVFKASGEKPQPVNFTRRFITFGVGYELGLPTGSMTTGMNPIHSISLNSSLPLSFISPNLQMGIDFTYGLYGSKSFAINYRQGGNYINTTVNYNSDVAQIGMFANYLFNSKGKFQPYVLTKLGYLEMTSSFSVLDPKDPDACRVLENETIAGDGTLYLGYGFGIRLNVGTNTSNKRNFIDFSISQTRGNTIDYVNVNHLHDHNAPTQLSPDAKPINITFINAGTQNIHQHRIAELHSNPLNILQFKISYVAYLRSKRR